MSNFSFLELQNQYALFSYACIEVERVIVSSPAMVRKVLVKTRRGCNILTDNIQSTQ